MKFTITPISAVAAAAALTLALGTAWAQGTAGTTGGTSGSTGSTAGGTSTPTTQAGSGTRNKETKKDDKLARGDRKFMEEAAGSGMFEVQAGQLAATKAQSQEVKSFASMLVDQHTKANSELMQLASSKGVELPPAPPRAMRNRLDNLGKKTGAEFDREFVREVGIKAHEKDIKDFDKAGKDVKDPELKAWATKTLPTLKEHLAAAQKLPAAEGKAGKQGASMGSSGSSGTSGSMGSTGGGAATGSGGASGANKSGS